MAKGFQTIDNVQLLPFPRFANDSGELCVYQGGSDVPFEIARTFSICAPMDAIRGNHAHHKCAQVVICPYGECEVVCQDGKDTQKFVMKAADQGLFIPPMIWASQIFLEENTVLFVICDRPYEEDDYIHDFESFVSLRNKNEK